MASGRLSKVKGKVLDIPNPPTIGTATAGSLSASVTFTAYSGGVGGPTRSYIAKSNPGNITATGSTSPITITGLTGDTSYTISVAGVNPTGTSEYSSASNSVTATNPGSYESIATVTLSSAQSNVTFNSFSGYTHLQLRAIMQSSVSGSGYKDLFIRVNSDTGSNYARHGLYGNGSSLVAYTTASIARMEAALTIPESANSGFGFVIIDLLDYANTNKYKTMRALGGTENNGAGYVGLFSSLWQNTNAITSIELLPSSGNFNTYSQFALYGIKGA